MTVESESGKSRRMNFRIPRDVHEYIFDMDGNSFSEKFVRLWRMGLDEKESAPMSEAELLRREAMQHNGD